VSSKMLHVTAEMFRTPLKPFAMLPEFQALHDNPQAFARRRAARKMLAACRKTAEAAGAIPQLTYTMSREFFRSGSRLNFDKAYHQKRHELTAVALLALLQDESRWIDRVHDYLWSICEESQWVPPEHIGSFPIDLFSSETGFALAEIIQLLGDRLDTQVVERVRTELERRLMAPYLERDYDWQDGHSNWTGVCEGAVGCVFLHTEPNPVRLAKAVNRVLAGLEKFRELAFMPDGGSTEGIGYWQYGLANAVAFGEMLCARTRGQVDYLAHEKFRAIARYPMASLVAPGMHLSCSDSHGHASFYPYLIVRLAERTGCKELLSMLHQGSVALGNHRFPWALRTLLWWDGRTHKPPKIDDHVLPDTGLVRLVAPRRKLAVMLKGGHNAENHNHNDVGSVAVYADGEPLLCDIGAGLYDDKYFGPLRYENPVCNSFGHSVPRIDEVLQGAGREHAGQITAFETTGGVKHGEVEFASAYPVKGLRSLHRSVTVNASGSASDIVLRDRFAWSGRRRLPVEEAFITWCPVTVRGRTALLRGRHHELRLAIVEPAGASFTVEKLPVMLANAAEPTTLRRLVCTLPPGATVFTMELRVEPKK
jgi:hypothetical protein